MKHSTSRALSIGLALTPLLACTADPSEDYDDESSEGSALVASTDELADAEGEGRLTVEEAFPGESGEDTESTFDLGEGPTDVTFQRLHGQDVFEGDILLGSSDAVAPEGDDAFLTPPADLLADEPAELDDVSAKSVAIKGNRWPSKTVSYRVSASLPNPDRVWGAIRHWKKHTPIRFRAYRGRGDAYVLIQPGAGCSAHLGYTGHLRVMTLENACSKGNVIHEFGHVIGLLHEQCRTDRNKHVTIHPKRIESGKASNFKIVRPQVRTTRYDINSIMHYGGYAFSDNGKPTITLVGGGVPSGQRRSLTKRDVAGVKEIY